MAVVDEIKDMVFNFVIFIVTNIIVMTMLKLNIPQRKENNNDNLGLLLSLNQLSPKSYYSNH